MADNCPKNPPTLGEALRDYRWACDLSDTEFARVEAGVFERRISQGGFICRKGEAVEYWVGLIDGLVKVSTISHAGKAVTFTGVPTGGWFGEGTVLKDEARQYDLVALRDTRIALMSGATFRWLLEHSVGFNRFLVGQLNERLGQFIGLLESERLLDTDARVARCLATLFNPVLYPGLGRQLQVSQEEIGYLTGVSRQRVNRSLKVLQFAGYLRVDYGSITILDLPGLRRFGG